MSHTNDSKRGASQPPASASGGRPGALSVTDLLTRYLDEQIGAHTSGLGYPEPRDEATPFEAVPVQPVDPVLAWKDATVAGQLLCSTATWTVPPDWPALVQQQEPAIALAFCLGNFPQQVRHLHPLLHGDRAALRQAPVRATIAPVLLQWAREVRGEPLRYLTAGVLRLAGQFDAAAEILADSPEPEFAALHGNEAAALAWHRGEQEKALELWRALPDSVPVRFNRGMASVFLGSSDQAVLDLDEAAAGLPDTSAWHHLALLYRTLATAG